MAAGRSFKPLVSRRRRGDEEGEDDEGPVMVEDSQSEGSMMSDEEEDASSVGSSAVEGAPNKATTNGSQHQKKTRKRSGKKATNITDTGAMILEASPAQQRPSQDARRKRDDDPALIPNRGNFFMHDTRVMRGAWVGRGRGRGGPSMNHSFPTAQPEEQLWKHDLHDTINEEPTMESGSKPGNVHHGPHTKLSFSSTTLVGKVQIRVFLPGMKAAVTFSEVPWKQYTRLPDHRPPLRRDKPARISLPGHVQRYIFPAPERSFIFIPRQMRPNHQSFGGGRYQRSIGGVGYSSRRTSMYGGSMYGGSRRSSFASVAREKAFSPVGSYAGMPPTRPIVRLPHGSQGQMHTFPMPAQPQYQGIPTTTMHQPRPQKAISVTGIESPALLQQHDAQPFANQLPAHFTEPAPLPPPYQYSYPPGTPLSGIPEQIMQPPMMPYYSHYPPHHPPHHQGYYYPPAPAGYPMYMAPNYSVPPMQQHNTPRQLDATPTASQSQSQSQSGMVAHESNGMVFYMPASEAPSQSQGEDYQPAESFVPSYAMPGLPPPTPAPDTTYYYHSPTMSMGGYYPTQ